MSSGTMERAPLAPVWGCVLIGGRSSRMGRPKHLLSRGGVTWLEVIVSLLREKTQQVVISGAGEIPGTLAALPVVPDEPGLQGPLAGILSVCRAWPEVSWLVAACDMPDISPEALDWLLSRRAPGVKAVLPDLEGRGQVEPLLAYYDRSCRELLEKMAERGILRPGALHGQPGVIAPLVPPALRNAWRNCNTPADLAAGDNSCLPG
ncbi:MAG: hypothetical protein Kow0089_21700 [Desulfobulbaceae bacterium]